MTARKKKSEVAPVILALPPLYKITGATGQSINGGSLAWPLPQNDQPGEWVRVEGKLVECERGLHVTPKPIHWWQPDARVWEVEIEPDPDIIVTSLDSPTQAKACVRAARLIREAAWADFCVWLDGEHEIREEQAYASGSASVTASGSASVTAYDSASVRASGSASVTAYDSASVRAYDSASVISSIYHSRSATVALADLAAHIDRRGDGKPKFRTAEVTA